jgi:hypothetical protein
VKKLRPPVSSATGRAPTALAAFVKRPQAVRFKSALPYDLESQSAKVNEKIIAR